MLNKYLQAGIGLAASLLTTPFLVQTAQAIDLSGVNWGGTSPSKLGPEAYVPPICDLGVPVGQGCTIANLLSGINPDGIILTPTDVETGINNENYSFSLCTVPPIGGAGGTLICEGDLIPIYEEVLGEFTCGTLAVPGCVINTGGIAPTAVPEPLTLLGASAAIAFGAGFKRRKKQG